MSEVTVSKSNVIGMFKRVQAEERNKRTAEGRLATPSNRIGVVGGVLRYKDRSVPNNSLVAVVADTLNLNVFYAQAYDPSNQQAKPKCFAYYRDWDEATPVKAGYLEYQKQAEQCNICPLAALGTAADFGLPGKGSACKRRLILVVMPLTSKTPDRITLPEGGFDEFVRSSPLAILNLPYSSQSNYISYFERVTEKGKSVTEELTRITVVPDQVSQYQVQFSPLSDLNSELRLPESAVRIVDERYERGDTEEAGVYVWA